MVRKVIKIMKCKSEALILCRLKKMNTVDAYENLIYDTLIGEQTKFTHWEELKFLEIY